MRRLPIDRQASAIAIAFALSACATSERPIAGAPSAAPSSELRLCPKIFIANQPDAEAGGRIAGFTPYLTLRGVRVARAPADGCLSSAFGVRLGGASVVHDGIDLYTREPRPVSAAGAGLVAWVKEIRGYGLTIEIDHGSGVTTRYAHLSSSAPGLRADRRVAAGEVIARTGRSGNATAVHLHYEIRIDGQPQDPLIAAY